MKKLRHIALLVGMAMGMTAQQLSLGPMALVGAGPSKTMNVVLDPQGHTLAGLQFDLTYDTSALTVSIALGSASTTAQMDLAVCGWPTGVAAATCAYTGVVGSSTSPSGSGQRAMIIGCCATGQSVPTSIAFANSVGVVAVLTVTPTAGANSGNQSITLTNASGTGLGGNLVAPASYNPLSIANGTANMYTTYLVGDVAPPTSDTAPSFGNAALNIQDLIQEFYAVNKVPGYIPSACSDRFDAADVFPLDTATARGGDGVLNIQDLIREFYRVNNVDTTRPARASSGGICTSSIKTSQNLTSQNLARRPETEGTLTLETVEATGSQDRVAVYLRAGRDLAGVAVTFGLGDQRSQLRFQAAPGITPSLMQDRNTGVVAVAWLEGLNVAAGQRILLGYVVGPSGSAANLKVFGVSASGLNDNRKVGLDVSGAVFLQQ